MAPVGGIAIGNFGNLTIANSTVTRNCCIALENFGTGTLAVTNSTFSDNVGVPGTASAIDNLGALTVSNNTFSSNRGDGGAIGNGGTMFVTNSTFSRNISSEGEAGAIGNFDGSLASVKNSISAGSTDFSGTPINNCMGTVTDDGYNMSDDDSCDFTATGSLNNSNPGLSSAGLANNGGPMQTIALVSGSPAIDAIPLGDCTDQNGKRLKTDRRGFPRPDAGEQVCDIGAFESQDSCAQNQQGNNNCQ